MGLKNPFIKQMIQWIKDDFESLDNIKMLEFGNQVVRPGHGYSETTGKDLWTNRGVNHTSVDVNGKHGSLIRDLSELNDFTQWENHFDVVYNAGTTEHVEPYRSQYTAFQIAHICCRHGGLMIHGVPSIELRERSGTWKRHCHYYYSEEFWRNLAKWNGYDIIHLELTTSWTAVYRKQKTSEWKIPKEVLLSEVHIRNEDIDFNDTNYSHQRKFFER